VKAVAAPPGRRGVPPEAEPVVLFEPDSWDRLIEGWLIHARKQREKHQLCARRCRMIFQWVSVPATVLSAMTTLPAVAALAGGPGAPRFSSGRPPCWRC
jgi:hypothetical protein